MRARPLSLAILALAAFPATAAAQGAADNQYSDPFANTPPPATTHHTTTHHTASGAETPATTPTTSGQGQGLTNTPTITSTATQTTATATATAAPTTTSSSTTSASLPRTGVNTEEEALIGLALLGAGLALRRRKPIAKR